MKSEGLRKGLRLACSSLGILLSTYACYVKNNSQNDSQFEATCDISESVSCSKVFNSEYGNIFSSIGILEKGSLLDLPNAVYGCLFYILIILLSIAMPDDQYTSFLLLILTSASMVLSAYLAYILSEVLQVICLVCFSTYACNLALFLSLIF